MKSRVRVQVDRRADYGALGLLLLAAILVIARAMGDASLFIRGDWPTFFLPMYVFLGERLRAFDIPGWNPYQFSGTPFVGDPSSGWMYVPAMFAFVLLPALPAVTAFIGAHLIISGVAAYLLARLTGLGPGGGLVAGAAYAFPWLLPASSGMVLMSQVTTWLPVALIGIELALQPGTPLRRFGGMVLTGVAISQVLAAWLGQSSYYALLLIGSWLLWRTLVTPPAGWSIRQRLAGLFGIGATILLIGFALNAAALLPRLDANLRSNVARGNYTGISGWADTKAGIDLPLAVRSLAGGFGVANWQYLGAAVIGLALLAPVLAWRWPPLLYWLIVPVVAIALQLPEPNTLQRLASAVLPLFDTIHAHLPDRILLLTPLPAAMLAGASADALSQRRVTWRSGLVLLLAALVIAAGAVALSRGGLISHGSLLMALTALAVALAAQALPPGSRLRPLLAPLALAAIVIWDPAGRVLAAGWGSGAGPERSLHGALSGEVHAFLEENGAASFLRQATRDAPGRYSGYDPALLPDLAEHGEFPPQVYRNQWRGPANWLLVHTWGTWFHVEDVQGYNPVHIRRYGLFIDALNGHRQEYHETDLFPAGLQSPLLPLLNLRYLIVPADAPQRPALEPLLAAMPTIYQDDHVLVLEHAAALPRAWLVHRTQQAAPEEALALLAAGSVDPSRIALLESAAPPLAPPADVNQEAEVVRYTRPGPDQIALAVSAQAPALVVLSEIWDPGWQAAVDGAPAPVYRANYVFQAIPVPAGDHTVTLRYTPPLLSLGLGISGGAVALLAAIAVGLTWRARRTTLGTGTAGPAGSMAKQTTNGGAGAPSA